MNEETYCVIKDFQSANEMSIVNNAIQDEEVLFTGRFDECQQFVDCCPFTIPDDIWPSRMWNQDHTDYIDLSGH
jgi:hypothetical protein